MPRQSRIDAYGALHHVIVRGNARRKIFYDDEDRDQFLDRFETILNIPNRFHLTKKEVGKKLGKEVGVGPSQVIDIMSDWW